MSPELHLHPDRLFSHAAAVAGLSEELRDALRGAPLVDGGLGVEQERLRAAVVAAVGELAEMSAALAAAASGAGAAEVEAAGSLRSLRAALGPE